MGCPSAMGKKAMMRTGRWIATLVIAAGLIASCTEQAQMIEGKLLPVGPGEYRYTVPGGITSDVEDPDLEALRVKVLHRKMDLNGFCNGRYTITNRMTIVTATGLIGPMHDVIYDVRCS